jgi:hypothetical protein
MTNTTFPVAGRIHTAGFRGSTVVAKATGTTITRGELLSRDAALTPDGFKTAAAADVRPFTVALETVTAAEAKGSIEVTEDGLVEVTASAAIEPGAYVKAAANGQVQTWVSGTDADNLKAGRYIRKPGEGGAGDLPTAAAASNVIIIDLVAGVA